MPREGKTSRTILGTCAQNCTFVVAIFSIARPELVCQRTLAFLAAQGVAQTSTYVFTAPGFHASETKPDVTMYKEMLGSQGFDKVNVVRGRQGLPQQINFINAFFDAGQHILFMSDTVRGCGVRHGLASRRKVPLPRRGIHALMSLAEKNMRETGALAWSVNCAKTFMSMGVDIASLKFGGLNGNMFGMRAGTLAKGLPPWCGLAFDYLLAAVLFQSAGCLLRFRFVSVENTYRMPGGHSMPKRARLKAQRACCARICNMFPDLMSLVRGASRPAKSCRLPIRTSPVGPRPLEFRKRGQEAGRPRKYFVNRAATGTERSRSARGAETYLAGSRGRKRVHFSDRAATSTERGRARRARLA